MMTPHAQAEFDAFVDAISDDPDNPTIRMVFADWLDDQGMCGDALRWSVAYNRCPDDKVHWFVSKREGQDFWDFHGQGHPFFLPRLFGFDENYKTKVGWEWFIDTFAQLQREGKISLDEPALARS